MGCRHTLGTSWGTACLGVPIELWELWDFTLWGPSRKDVDSLWQLNPSHSHQSGHGLWYPLTPTGRAQRFCRMEPVATYRYDCAIVGASNFLEPKISCGPYNVWAYTPFKLQHHAFARVPQGSPGILAMRSRGATSGPSYGLCFPASSIFILPSGVLTCAWGAG